MLRDNLAGLIEPMLSSVAAHTLGGHPKRDKLGDAPGQPSWRSSLVSDPSATFWVGNRATGEKNEWPGFKVTTQAHDSLAVRTAQRKSHRTIDPQCLENPRPEGAESTLTGNAASPFPAEPRHDQITADLAKGDAARLSEIQPVLSKLEQGERNRWSSRQSVGNYVWQV
jgi:hypothetical protein